jgi:glycosyltransferase involved in cell wall biosynthesis
LKVLFLGEEMKLKGGGPGQVIYEVYNQFKNNNECYAKLILIKRGRKLLSYLEIIKCIIFYKFDIINIHSGNLVPFVFSFMPLAIRKKVVITQHGYEGFENDLKGLRHKLYIRLTKYSFRRVGSFIFVSTYFYNLVKHLLPDIKRIFIIHNGLSEDVTNYKNNYKKNDYTIFIGGTRLSKGLDILLHLIIKHELDIKLKIFGHRGNIDKRINVLCDYLKRFGSVIINYGSVSNDRIYSELAFSNICIVPSRFDSFNTVILEAMYFKNIVICSHRAGASEIINNGINGYIYNDKEEMISIIRKIKENNTHGEMRRNANITANRFLWKYVAKTYHATFTEIINNQ